MKPSKKQRHKVYKYALNLLSINNDIGKNSCICGLLTESHYQIFDEDITIFNVFDYYPEFYKQRPAKVSALIYWWPLEDQKIRKEVLQRCISETKSYEK